MTFINEAFPPDLTYTCSLKKKILFYPVSPYSFVVYAPLYFTLKIDNDKCFSEDNLLLMV